LPKLRAVHYKQLDVQFGDGVRSAREHAKDLLPDSAATDSPESETPNPGPLLEYLAYVDPRIAILEAWAKVEIAAVDLLRRAEIGLEYEHTRRFKTYEAKLKNAGLLTGNILQLFQDLRNLRNSVAHAAAFAVTPANAAEYLELAVNQCHVLEHQQPAMPAQ
jgi:hypothetical protein